MKQISHFLLMRENIASNLADTQALLKELGSTSRGQFLQEIENELLQSNFRVLVAGEFKRGKTCFINALLGNNVLPMKIAPCTGSITEIQYSETPSLTLIPTHDEPFTAPFEDLNQYCTIQGQKGHLLKKLVVHYPTEIARKAITLIDSPGLNEDWSRTKTSLREIATADALILVLSCEMALSQSELQFIHSHLLPYTDRLFFLWNRADAIWDKPEEKLALEKRSAQYLSQFSDRIFYVSAREGLLAKLQHDEERLEFSQVEVVQKAVEQFILEHKAHDKLKPSILTALHTIAYANTTLIPRLQNFLGAPLHILEEHFEKAQGALENIRVKRLEIRASIQEHLHEILDDIIDLVDVYNDELQQQVFEAAQEVVFPPKINRQEREDIIISWFDQWLQQSLHHLAHHTIKSSMTKHFENLRMAIDSHRQEFHQEVLSILDDENANEVMLFPGKWIGELSIIIATSLSLMLLNIGRDKVCKSLLEVRAIRGWITGNQLAEGDRLKLAQKLAHSFQQERDAIIFHQRSHLEETMKQAQSMIDQEMQMHLDDIIEQIQYALDVRQTSIVATDKAKLNVSKIQASLKSIQENLQEELVHVSNQ